MLESGIEKVGVDPGVDVDRAPEGVFRPASRSADDRPAVERRGVVGECRCVVVRFVDVDELHALDREAGIEQQAEDADDAVRVVGVHDELTLMLSAVVTPVVQSQEPEVLDGNRASGPPRVRHALPVSFADGCDTTLERRWCDAGRSRLGRGRRRRRLRGGVLGATGLIRAARAAGDRERASEHSDLHAPRGVSSTLEVSLGEGAGWRSQHTPGTFAPTMAVRAGPPVPDIRDARKFSLGVPRR